MATGKIRMGFHFNSYLEGGGGGGVVAAAAREDVGLGELLIVAHEHVGGRGKVVLGAPHARRTLPAIHRVTRKPVRRERMRRGKKKERRGDHEGDGEVWKCMHR